MSGEFNKIPNQCADCPLEQKYVDSNDAVLTRNCSGPSYDESTFQGSTTVRGGEVIAIDREKNGIGVVACRNTGLIAWKEAAELQYLAAQES